MWKFVFKYNPEIPKEHTRKTGMLSMPLGMLERGLYTCVLIAGMWPLIAGWFGLKVAAKWKMLSDHGGADNVWLIGSGLSLLFGLIGAWIAIGHMVLASPPR